jgi:glycosyltransferase involved in cell wall biosynthesis
MRLAVCSLTGHPTNPLVWSGIPAHLVAALERIGERPELIGPLAPLVYRTANWISGVTARLGGHKVNWEVEPTALEFFTRALRRDLKRLTPDVVILLGWYPWMPRPEDPPMVYWGDATVAQRIDRSPHWSNLSKRTRRLATEVEGAALRALPAIFMPSTWARDDTIARYDLEPSRVHRVALGANVDDPGILGRERPVAAVRLLAVGVKWHRKGFDRAVLAVDELHRRGIYVDLDIVGVDPPDESWRRPYVTYHGFLSKAVRQEAMTIDALYRDADIFVLPSRNDPFPMVLGEAGAYALPVVASNVGGVKDRVSEGGILLNEQATPEAYANAVEELLGGHYSEFSRGSRRDFETRSNWIRSARRAVHLCEELVRA